MPDPIPVAAALAATHRKIGVQLKLPPILDQLPDKARAELDDAIVSDDYSSAHLCRAINLILAQHGIPERVTDNTVKAYREHVRGNR